MMKRPGHFITKQTLFESCKSKRKQTEPESQKLVTTGLHSESIDAADANKNGCVNHRSEEKDLENRIKLCIRNLTANPNAVDHGVQAVLLTMQQIYSELKYITQRMQRDDNVQDAKNEWKFAAMVVDRLCLCVFTMVIICCTCGIMFAAPHIVV